MTNSDQSLQPEISFDGLRSALTPINLMFDGRLYKDLKGLFTHINHAIKRVEKEKPDYQGALTEITLLEAAYNNAYSQWENKLTGEIQRLKNTIETSPKQSLGAKKQITKYEAELNRGRASTRSMPTKTSQVRNQLIAACGRSTNSSSTAADLPKATSRLSKSEKKLPAVYKNATSQIVRKARKLEAYSGFGELAKSYLKKFSRPLKELGADEVHCGVLYMFDSPLVDFLDGENEERKQIEELVKQKSRFAFIRGLSDDEGSYEMQSLFKELEHCYSIPFDKFDTLKAEVFEALDEKSILLTLLDSKFKQNDLATTFGRYYLIRKKAEEDNREPRFNPGQQAIHDFLFDLAFEFVGIEFESKASEIRLIAEIDNALQSR